MSSPAMDAAVYMDITVEQNIAIKGGYNGCRKTWHPSSEDVMHVAGQTFVKLQSKDHGLKRMLTGDGCTVFGKIKGITRLAEIRSEKCGKMIWRRIAKICLTVKL